MKNIGLFVKKKVLAQLTLGLLVLGGLAFGTYKSISASPFASAPTDVHTQTPIKYLVVIFQENVSFDHYFGTYPVAANLPGEPRFQSHSGTPRINGLTPALLNHNPNKANPHRLSRSDATTCDMDHDYLHEQKAYNNGEVDMFIQYGGNDSSDCDPKTVMGYFDGNTVTAMWNYAQNFALSDNFYNTTFGSSTLGALNLVSGQTHGVLPKSPGIASKNVMQETVIADVDPLFDDCADALPPVAMRGRNVGDLLNAKGITWGWFQGGFRPTKRTKDGKAICRASHMGAGGKPVHDYIPSHEPFQFYASTANPHHLPPSSVANIGHTDQANHQYDLSDFWGAVQTHHLPAVSFLKAPAYQDGHAGYSNPLKEQAYLVQTINRLQQSREWKDMAILIAYDDSDGWYDHQMPPLVNGSVSKSDDLTAPGACGKASPGAYMGRCGFGPRLPLLAMSPYAKVNFVDHQLTDQTSILRFIEDNWKLGRIGDQSFDAQAGSLLNMFDFKHYAGLHRVLLNPETGQLAH